MRTTFRLHRLALAACLLSALYAVPQAHAQDSDTLDQVRATGTLKLGYLAEARPFTWQAAGAQADGYGAALCKAIAAATKASLRRPDLKVDFVAIGDADPLQAVQDGRVDLLCTPLQATLSRRARVSFSIPVFAGGTGVLVRANARAALRKYLEGHPVDSQPVWRGSPHLDVLQHRNFAVIEGTASQRWLNARKNELGVNSIVTPVHSLDEGVARVGSGQSDAFLADRSVLLDRVRNDPQARSLAVLDREFDPTAYALALRRGDEDFRLLVDRALSAVYRSGAILPLYGVYFGPPSATTREGFQRLAEPE
jgi:polar amino acid transport system substrate-binding protein